jgi:hypothetical protein
VELRKRGRLLAAIRKSSWTSSCAAVALLSALAPASVVTAQTQPVARTAAELMIVDCLLPGKLRSLGGRTTYLTPRRPARTTALDCSIRGGEYTAYDRASYQTSLSVWLDEAKKGNAEAQYYVGRIYERGQGTEADYGEAMTWYSKAAAQGHHAAQFSVGYLYEKGLGVPTDSSAAMNWYRRAEGLPDDLALLPISDLAALQQAESEREQEIETLQHQLEDLKKQLENAAADRHALEEEIGKRTREVEAKRKEIARLKSDIGSGAASEPHGSTTVPLGRFVALIIGNDDYRHLPRVPSADHDANAIAALLREQYGFQVKLLRNATRLQMLNELSELRKSMTDDENLLIFYAGHAKRDSPGHRAWWQPADAEAENPATWLSDEDLGDQLNIISARHILILADSCYEGELTRGAVTIVTQGMSAAKRDQFIRENKSRKARLALTSGADEPVAAPSSPSSRFTTTLIKVLGRGEGVFDASWVYLQALDAMKGDGKSERVHPTYSPIRYASHEGGTFFFSRKPGS